MLVAELLMGSTQQQADPLLLCNLCCMVNLHTAVGCFDKPHSQLAWSDRKAGPVQ
jgi:hypothetical protein